MNYRTFLYRIDDLNNLGLTGFYLKYGLLSSKEQAQQDLKNQLKLITSRWSFSKIFNITPNKKFKLYNLLKLRKDYHGKPYIILTDFFCQSFKFHINDLIISFSYQSGYIACGFVYTLEHNICVV